MALINKNQTLVNMSISNLRGLNSTYGDIYNSDYGFRDTVNLTDSVVCPKILTLDQQWIFLSLANNLNRTIWKYFYKDQGVRDTHCEMYNCSELAINNVKFSRYEPLENEMIAVNFTVQNYGNADANDTVIKFYVDGTYQNESTINVSAGGNSDMQFSWGALYGTHNISAGIDPADLIVESNETNNTANGSILVVKGNRTEVNATANQTMTVAAGDIGIDVDFVVCENLNGTINITQSDETPLAPLNSTFGLMPGEYDIEEYTTINVSENVDGNLTWAVLKIYYNTSQLDRNSDDDHGDAGIDIDPATLKFYWFNGSHWKWLDYSNEQYNNYTSEGGPLVYGNGVNQTPVSGYLGYAWVNVSHFSVYGVGGQVMSPPNPCPNPPCNGPNGKKRIYILANSIDLNLSTNCTEYMKKFVYVDYLNASTNFSKYNKSRYIVILGGHNATGGVGDIVKGVLNDTEMKNINESVNGTFYIKENVWAGYQRVFILAGKDRNVTKEACLNNKEALKSELK
jgi:hypothetical protein